MKKKLFTLLTFAFMATFFGLSDAFAADYPDDNYLLLNGANNKTIASSQVVGSITFTCNTSTYTYQSIPNSGSAKIAGNSFTKGLKHESATYTEFTTTEVGTITIIGWNGDPNSYPFVPRLSVNGGSDIDITSWDNLITKEYGSNEIDGYQNVVIYKVCNAAAGKYKITRGSKQNWMLYVGVTYGETSSYTITTAMSNGGSSTVTGGGSYLDGATATLTATPVGKAFSHWELEGTNVSTDNPYSFTVSKDATYTAVFEDATTHTITGAIADGQSEYGTITNEGGNSVVENETITFVATANTGYAFVNWTKDGSEYSTEASITITSTEANAGTYTANFKKLYVVTYDAGAGSFGTTDKVTKTAYADAKGNITLWSKNGYIGYNGYTLTGWNDGTNDYELGEEVTLTSDVTMTAVFTENPVSLNKSTAKTTVKWDFTNIGTPGYHVEENKGDGKGFGYYTVQATVNGTSVDFPMYINASSDNGGKFYTVGRTNAQVNATTIFTIPAVSGMIITIGASNGTTMTTDNTKIAGESPTISDNTATYTYTGNESTIEISLGSGRYYDYIQAEYPKTATSLIVGEAGYRTFTSSSALDFTDGVEGLTAYRAVVTSDAVEFVEIDGEVPAKEGMLIKAEPGTYYIPLASGTPTEIENAFEGVTTPTEKEEGIYVLLNDAENGLGFYKTTKKFTVGANTAYLPSTVSNARSISLPGEGDDDTTGIIVVENEKAADGKYFDLQGRQVSNPTKGLYIYNGKKYIVK